ncbi:MAG: hypothetical protein HKN29_13425 [Rhodothermales bacterium]|nr:hypothetical protein [Rhodothermales bacterium]
MKGEVLFFDFGFEEYLPLIEGAASRGVRPIMNQAGMRSRLAASGVEARGFLEFATAADQAAARDQARDVIGRFSSTIKSLEAVQAFDAAPGNLLISGGADLARSLLTIVENQILVANIMSHVIDQTDLRAVVMRSCLSSGQRMIQQVADRAGIPVIEISHGNPPWDSDLVPPPIDWHFAAFGAREREVARERAGDPDHIHLTGAPHWDGLYSPINRPDRDAAKDALGLPRDIPFLLYAGSYSPGSTLFFASEAQRVMRANEMVASAVGKLIPQPLLGVRPHPGESRQKPGRRPTQDELTAYRDWFTAHGANLIHVDYSETSIVREKAVLIRAADAVIIPEASSTMITEVLLLGRPCVVIADEESPFRSFYSPDDGVAYASNAHELGTVLDRIITDPAYVTELHDAAEAALPELNHGHDGQATTRLVNLVIDLAA